MQMQVVTLSMLMSMLSVIAPMSMMTPTVSMIVETLVAMKLMAVLITLKFATMFEVAVTMTMHMVIEIVFGVISQKHAMMISMTTLIVIIKTVFEMTALKFEPVTVMTTKIARSSCHTCSRRCTH